MGAGSGLIRVPQCWLVDSCACGTAVRLVGGWSRNRSAGIQLRLSAVFGAGTLDQLDLYEKKGSGNGLTRLLGAVW